MSDAELYELCESIMLEQYDEAVEEQDCVRHYYCPQCRREVLKPWYCAECERKIPF